MYETTARRKLKPSGLLLVPMIDIFTVLVTFLLMTAVFARITILELDLPSSAGGRAADPPQFRLEVIVRKAGLELTNGTHQIATIPNVDGAYDLKTLSDAAVSLKREYPQTVNASVLMEQEVDYDTLIQVMDAIRSVDIGAIEADPNSAQGEWRANPPVDTSGEPQPTRVALFTKIAVGDAP